jgi:hypothetical protein
LRWCFPGYDTTCNVIDSLTPVAVTSVPLLLFMANELFMSRVLKKKRSQPARQSYLRSRSPGTECDSTRLFSLNSTAAPQASQASRTTARGLGSRQDLVPFMTSVGCDGGRDGRAASIPQEAWLKTDPGK